VGLLASWSVYALCCRSAARYGMRYKKDHGSKCVTKLDCCVSCVVGLAHP